MAYGSVSEMVSYLARTGRALPDDAILEQALEYGSDYVDQFEDIFCGKALSYNASFPRDRYVEVPRKVEQAAYEAAYAFATGVPIFGDGGMSSGQVTKEKVDVLELTYASPQDGSDWWVNNRYILPQAYSKLLPFICIPDPDGCKGGPSAFIV